MNFCHKPSGKGREIVVGVWGFFVVVWVGEVGAGFAVGFAVAEVALPFAEGEVAGESGAGLGEHVLGENVANLGSAVRTGGGDSATIGAKAHRLTDES